MAAGAAGVNSDDFDRLWDYGDPAGSEARFRAALGEPPPGAGGERELAIATQIARALGLQGRFAEGHAELDRIESRLAGAEVAGVRALLERGRLHNSAGDPARAVPLFEEALARAGRLGAEYHAVDAAHMLGIAASPPVEALEWNRRAIAMAEDAADPRARGWLGALLNNTAWLLHDGGDAAGALVLFERALSLRRQSGAQSALRIAAWSVARCLRTLGRVEEALARQRALLAGADADTGAANDGFIAEEIGECLWALGERSEARERLREAAERLAVIPWVARERVEDLRNRGGGE